MKLISGQPLLLAKAIASHGGLKGKSNEVRFKVKTQKGLKEAIKPKMEKLIAEHNKRENAGEATETEAEEDDEDEGEPLVATDPAQTPRGGASQGGPATNTRNRGGATKNSGLSDRNLGYYI